VNLKPHSGTICLRTRRPQWPNTSHSGQLPYRSTCDRLPDPRRSIIAIILKFGERTQIGAIHLASSLVADLGLLSAAWIWASAVYFEGGGLTPGATASIVSMSAGALAANILSVIMLLVETVMFRR
jgi:hypothetical protein